MENSVDKGARALQLHRPGSDPSSVTCELYGQRQVTQVSLGLSFCICKMDTLPCSASQDCGELI